MVENEGLGREELERIETQVMSVGCTDANARLLLDHGKALLARVEELERRRADQRGFCRAAAADAQEAEALLAQARAREEELRAALTDVCLFAAAHHDDQEAYVLLHALTVDIPAQVEDALASSSPAPEGEGT